MKFRIPLLLIAILVFLLPVNVKADISGKTKYPIVLVHGMGGFDSIYGYDYFYGVRPALSRVGAYNVYTPRVTAWQNDTVRGEELLRYLLYVKATTGAQKFNLIGHSQGGPTSRYVASVRPDLVASVTSIGSPHFGSEVADAVSSLPRWLYPIISNFVNSFGNTLAYLTGDPGQKSNALNTLSAVTTNGSYWFNRYHSFGLRRGYCRAVPYYYGYKDYSVNDGPRYERGVRYYSWHGVYNPYYHSNSWDIADIFLNFASNFHSEANDGLVGRCKSHLGQVIRDDYILNHGDQINWTFGIRGYGTNDPLALYINHARRLRNAGL